MTPERIERHDDERLYQPRIHSRWIRTLHRISEEIGEPMTVLVDEALRRYVAHLDSAVVSESGVEDESEPADGR